MKTKNWKSYPKTAKTEQDAEKLAASAALEDLQRSVKELTITKSNEKLIKNILDIVNQHPNGIFQSKIEENYVETYNENLPKDWIDRIKNVVNVDTGANLTFILSPRKTSDPNMVKPDIEFVASEPGRVILDCYEGEDLWIYINIAYNTSDIWGIVMDPEHSGKLLTMAAEMKSRYDVHKQRPQSITVGSYYAFFEEDWHRVRCIRLDETKHKATIFFIDRGDEDVVELDRIYVLEPRFCQLQAQSIRLSMSGLEMFSSFEEINGFISNQLIEKEVQITDYKQEKMNGELIVSAQLYKDSEEGPININEIVFQEIMKRVDSSQFLKTGRPATQVEMSHIEDMHNIFARITNSGLQFLEKLIDESTSDDKELDLVSGVRRHELYLTKHEDRYQRVKVLNSRNDGSVQALLIDHGKSLILKREDLRSMEGMEILLRYPNQAQRITLHKINPITYDRKMAEKLKELTCTCDSLIMKCVGEVSTDKVPVVELFKRMENNVIASINDNLVLAEELTRPSFEEQNLKAQIRNDRSSLGVNVFPIPAPKIDDTEYFDVHVTMAANPGNFTVQPLASKKKLGAMMLELSMHCRSYEGPPIAKGSVKIGQMYAAKYDDGNWYRAYVSQVIDGTLVVVYFCDYGDFKPIPIDRLQTLEIRFYAVPYQAIKAKLHGVAPALGDWSVNDCLKFHELVVGKGFVSTIKGKKPDPKTGETVYELELIDTSNKDEDVYISKVLIDEGRAVKH